MESEMISSDTLASEDQDTENIVSSAPSPSKAPRNAYLQTCGPHSGAYGLQQHLTYGSPEVWLIFHFWILQHVYCVGVSRSWSPGNCDSGRTQVPSAYRCRGEWHDPHLYSATKRLANFQSHDIRSDLRLIRAHSNEVRFRESIETLSTH